MFCHCLACRWYSHSNHLPTCSGPCIAGQEDVGYFYAAVHDPTIKQVSCHKYTVVWYCIDQLCMLCSTALNLILSVQLCHVAKTGSAPI